MPPGSSNTTTRHGLRPLRRQALEGAFAMGAVGGEVVALPVGDERQGQRRIEHGQGQRRPEQAAHLRQRGNRRRCGRQLPGQAGRRQRVEADHRGRRRYFGRLLLAPPLSAPSAIGAGRGNGGPGSPASCGDASPARSAVRSGRGRRGALWALCPPRSRTRWASACRSRAPARQRRVGRGVGQVVLELWLLPGLDEGTAQQHPDLRARQPSAHRHGAHGGEVRHQRPARSFQNLVPAPRRGR